MTRTWADSWEAEWAGEGCATCAQSRSDEDEDEDEDEDDPGPHTMLPDVAFARATAPDPADLRAQLARPRAALSS